MRKVLALAALSLLAPACMTEADRQIWAETKALFQSSAPAPAVIDETQPAQSEAQPTVEPK